MRILALMTATLALWATPAAAQECTPEFADTAQTVTVNNVQIGAGETSRESFRVRVRNSGDGQCSASIRFARIDGSSVSGNLAYTLRSGSSSLQILPNQAATATSDSDLFIAGVPGGRNGRAIPFLLTVPSEWGIASGFHSEQLELTLLDSTGRTLDTLLLTINVTIPPAVAMRVVGATGSDNVARINLGTITPRGITRSDPFGIRVFSTSAYLVSFVSENRGNLMHEGGQDTIPYEMRMDNQLVNLRGRGTFSFPRRTNSLGRIHRLRVQAGPATGRAGSYGDRVTVTVTAV